MAERIADLYLDLSVRGADNLDQTLRRGRESLEQMGEQADETAEATRQAALRSTSAYERVARELQNTNRAYQRHAQEVRDSAQREEMAMQRMEDARRRYGDTSDQAIRAEEAWQRAQRESQRASQRAERQMDQLRIAQQRAAQAAQRAARDVRSAGEEISQPISPPEINGAEGAGEDAGDGMGGGFMAGFAARIAGLGSKAGPIGAAIAGVAAIGLGAGAMLANAIVEGAEREALRDQMQANLGIDEATARRMATAASEAYMDVFGNSVAENMATLTSLGDFQLLDTSASQADMEGLIAKTATLNQMLGTETPDSLRAVSGLVRSGMVSDIDAAYDLIVAARQQGLDAQGDLIDSISEYSTGWKNTGLTAEMTMGLIKQSMSLGVDNTDRASDAIREFGRRMTEEGDTIKETLNGIDLNGEQLFNTLKSGGPEANRAFDLIFDKIRSIEDPLKRNDVAMKLLGDTAGDFIGAYTQWDPSKALDEFGASAGAAERATSDLGANTATSWEGMRRTAEESVEGIKAALAEAFGPEVAKIAEGIAANKDEIVAFFADVVSAALTFSIGLGNTMAGALKVFGYTTGAIQSLLGGLMSMFTKAYGAIGGLIEHIPGMQGIGQQMQDSAKSAEDFTDSIAKTSERSLELADMISNQLVPGMTASRDRFNELADNAREGATEIDFLSGAVTRLPDGKSIIIQDNSPETRARLEELGYTVTTLPDGSVRVEANTGPAQTTLDEFLRNNANRKTIVEAIVKPMLDPNYKPAPNAQFPAGFPKSWSNPKQPNADGSIREYADGGVDGHLPDQAVIQPARGKRGLVQWAESDAGPWEAFIPGAPNKRGRAMSILSEVADRFGYSLYRSYADGGISGGRVPYGLPVGSSGPVNEPWVDELERAFGVEATTYAGHQERDGFNKGIDWSGPVENMQRLAEYFASIASQLEQVIWQNPQTGQQIGVADGRFVGPGTDQPGYYSADWSGHQDHVHTRQSFALPLPGQSYAVVPGGVTTVPLIQKPDGTWTSPDPAWAALIARESGGIPDRVQEVQDANSGGNEASGLFQIARGTWAGNGGTEFAPTAGQATPEQQAIVAARIFEKSGGQPWGAGLPGRENEDALRAGLSTTGGGYGYGVEPGGGYDGSPGSTPPKPKEPPKDPNTVELTFDNPFQPFWWKGEKEYQQRIIDNYEAEQAWQDYLNQRGDWAPKEQKQATSRKTLAEATRDLADAQDDLRLAELRQKELDPKSKESAKESARQAVEKARRDVEDAQAALDEAKRMPNPVKQYAMGDVRNGHQPEIVRPGDYRLWGEPESGGESYIPHAKDRRARALGIWAETGRILGVQGFDQGGFGGYAADTRDAMAPKNLYDLMALGVGGTMTALNTIAPYVKMAMTGQVDLGNMTPNVDLGANSPPLVAEYVGQVANQISQQLTEIVWAIKDGKNIRVTVENATGPSGLSLTRRGK
ncbi:transglycosylase family protein [Gordonia sp. WA4-43]|uniref:transglycosylase family protein n=1 Tax=Gordonia sp. WA4-43 TaxID=2878678 RepID=UPI001CFA44DE|nr:transglycosylase family protein [Gordonia sp. WA4-43]UCZ89068.1 phage tail tape measure protein [Gordonia sp. WA4-43]